MKGLDVVAYMWHVLETALERNDVSFNHSGYTKAVIPYLLMLNPEYEETVICMTKSLRDLQKNRQAKQAEPNVLDLSNHATAEDDCINLAKHISAVLKDPRTPVRLYNAMSDELSSLGMLQDIVDSPEYVAKQLCNEETREVKR